MGSEVEAEWAKDIPDAHFADEDPLVFRLDLFSTTNNATWQAKFGMQGGQNIKPAPAALFPGLTWTISDKLETIPLRSGRDREDKRAKDFIDIYNLAFQNKEGVSARELAASTGPEARRRVLRYLDNAIAARPQYDGHLETLRDWLRGA